MKAHPRGKPGAKRSAGRAPRRSSWVLTCLALVMLSLGLLLGYTLNCRPTRQAPPPSSKPTIKRNIHKEPPRSAPVEVRPPAAPVVPRQPAAPEPAPKAAARTLPKIALVIDDLGYAPPELVMRLCAQPVPLTVAVLPFLEHTRRSAEIAHAAGKEVLLHLPMEPLGFPGPSKDPGPGAVMASLSEAETRLRVRRALLEVPFRKGVNNHMGSRITPDRQKMTWVLDEVRAKGYCFLDSRTEKDSVAFEVAAQLGIPTAQRQVFLDDDKSIAEMERQWNRAMDIAHKEGQVVVIGHIYPETLAALERLIPRSRPDHAFVPVSGVASIPHGGNKGVTTGMKR